MTFFSVVGFLADHNLLMAKTPEYVKRAKILTTATFYADDTAFVESFRAGDRSAKAELYRRYAPDIERVLYRVLGWDAEILELMQEVFLRAIAGARGFRGGYPELKPWLTRIAVFTARGWIRKRRLRKWLQHKPPEEIPDVPAVLASAEEVETLKRVYAVIKKMPVKERIPFTLRYMDEMDLVEVADACDVSLATIKRRLQKGRQRFISYAKRDPYLNECLSQSDLRRLESVS
ncbi:MAG: RNA polymerase sigma factor [Deltaproteobacteria bacterium]|nr:RNA polymerase sigma factor [Deltaproteobacteria bacterium]